MEEKKSPIGKILLVIFILILMCACLVGGYFIHDVDIFKKSDSNNNKEIKTEEKTKESSMIVYDITDEKIANLVENLIVGLDCFRLESFTNDKIVKASDISNDLAYDIAIFQQSNSDSKDILTIEEVTKMVQNYLGKDYKFNPDSMKEKKGTCISYYYDKNKKQFVSQETACGGTCGPRTSYIITKAVDTDGVLELDVRVIFVKVGDGTGSYYSDYNKTNKIGSFENYSNSLFEKGKKYKFTFKDEDGHYVFVSSEPV